MLKDVYSNKLGCNYIIGIIISKGAGKDYDIYEI